MIDLYLETNYFVGCATGRNRLDLDRPDLGSSFRAVIPDVCFLEAFAWMEGEKKRRRAFGRSLSDQAVQLKRDLTSPIAASLHEHLGLAVVENDRLSEHILERLTDAVSQVAGRAELLPVTATILEASRREILIDELTDNLIIHCILDHARANPSPDRAFFSENSNDFGRPEVRAALDSAGVAYFRDADTLIGWAAGRGPSA